MIWYKVILALVLSYLIGSFQSSYWMCKIFKHIDIREHGSGNPGATNVMRVCGFKFGFFVLFLDALKGALAVLLVKYGFHCDNVAIQLLSGLACILGHNFPFYLGFKGGKGVASTLGIMLVINWKVFLLAGVPALIALLSTRIMSIASLTFGTMIVIAVAVFYFSSGNFVAILIAAACYPLMMFYRHRQNIKRLVNKEEKPLWEWKKKDKE
ncbi:MAG: glycerol-3-phosphate 1-O-acyltransferase PlsY [Clostridia bacterium]|nr:glycerol-3-phosphate 1-O-acyltransferase PlsY [Clostridia bacterium]